MYFWETSILGNESRKEKDSDKTYVAYQIVVQDSSHSWTIEKRYNDFYSLHSVLKDKFAENQLPQVPPKGFQFFTNNDPKFLKERAVALEKYIRALLKTDSPTSQCGDVLDFLDPNRKSTLNNSLPIAPPEKNPIAPLPPSPPRLFILHPESIFLPDGEECFLPQFFDYIAESIKYLVQVDSRITGAQSAQSKMNIFEVEKARIKSTITSLTDQQKVAIQILQSATTPAPSTYNNYHTTDYSYNNNYSNMYNNPYTNNNRPPQPQNYPNHYQSHNPNANYSNYPPHNPNTNYSNYPPHNRPDVVLHRNSASAPQFPHNGYPGSNPGGGEGHAILAGYLGICLQHIQDAIIWESGLETTILAQCVDVASGWCEIQERLKWFDAECEKSIVSSLGVTLSKEAKKALRKTIKSLKEQAKRYYEELAENPKHKCTLCQSQTEHVTECMEKLKKTINFIAENKKRTSGSTALEIVIHYESKMYTVLESIANLETATYTTHEERKEYKDKAAEIRKKITSIMKRVTDFKSELVVDVEKVKTHEGDKSNLPDESSLNSMINRLEDLQENLADLSHDFGKALEIAKRDSLGGILKERQLEDARKEHVQHEDNMFEL